jgi:flagellar motor switch protein FliN/FliY
VAEPIEDDTNENPVNQADASDSPASTTTDESPAAGDPPLSEAESKRNLGADEIEKLLEAASDNLNEAVGGTPPAGAGADAGADTDPSPNAGNGEPKPFQLGNLTQDAETQSPQSINLLGEVEMDLRVELGRTRMRLEEVLQLRGGSVVALDKLAGDPVDIFVNGRLIARGEVLVMNDNFCIRVTELVGA